MPGRRPWTEEDRAILRQMAEAGRSAVAIAGRLRRSIAALLTLERTRGRLQAVPSSALEEWE